jgi:hypothetical protein
VLGVAGYFAVTAFQSHYYSPDDPVKALVTAFTNHDLDKAGELAGCSGEPLCKAASLGHGYAPPTGLSVTGVRYVEREIDKITHRPDKSHAIVGLRYQLGEQTYDQQVAVDREGSGWSRRWHIAYTKSPLYATVEVVSQATPRAQLAGVTVSTAPAGKAKPQHALPGVYTVTAAGDDPLFDSIPLQMSVPGGQPETAPAQLQLGPLISVKPAVVDEVNRQVKALVDGCAQKTDAQPVGCPFEGTGAVVSAVHWTIVDYPQLDVLPADTPADAADGGPAVVSTLKKGHAQATYAGGQMTADIDVHGFVTIDKQGKASFHG